MLDLSSVAVAVAGAALLALVGVRVPVDHGALVSPLFESAAYALEYLISMFLPNSSKTETMQCCGRRRPLPPIVREIPLLLGQGPVAVKNSGEFPLIFSVAQFYFHQHHTPSTRAVVRSDVEAMK